MVRYAAPSPYMELSHTADVGIRAWGQELAEVYARAALAMAQLQAGGGAVEATGEEKVVEAGGEDPPSLLVDLCRKVLAAFFLERRLLAAIEIAEISSTRLKACCRFGAFDPERHGEGMDIKAVTYARAAVTPRPEGGYEATLIFDI